MNSATTKNSVSLNFSLYVILKYKVHVGHYK